MVRLRACSSILSTVSERFVQPKTTRYLSTTPVRSVKEEVPSLDSDEALSQAYNRRKHAPEKVIFSGIQPTGIPHLGNYLGALRQWKDYQDAKLHPKKPKNYRLIFSIVDLHALTHYQSPVDLLQRRRETFASLLALGLKPRECIVYFQSSVSQHTELMWILSNVASTGYLSRMTQWKSKLGVSEDATIEDQQARENLRLGLFSYPVLQAADILLFGADMVPVGEDQIQHVEFARNLARSFNSQYKDANLGQEFFKIPNAILSPAKRVMSLRDPTTKMSKSHPDPRSRIVLTDSPEDVRSKIKGALTDSTPGISYDIKSRPGISNLVEILKHVTGETASCEDIAADHTNQGVRAFKEHVAEEIVKSLAGFRDRYAEVMSSDNTEIEAAMFYCPRKASSLAGKRMKALRRLIGLQDWKAEHDLENKSKQYSTKNRKRELEEQESKYEDEDEDETVVVEPDVVPQYDQGVDRPIAS